MTLPEIRRVQKFNTVLKDGCAGRVCEGRRISADDDLDTASSVMGQTVAFGIVRAGALARK
jgi:hypothetical protein